MRHAIRPLLVFFAAALPACTVTAAPPDAAPPAEPPAEARSAREAEIGRFFEGRRGTFVLLDARTGRTVVHDTARARTPFLPASTFKIPNTLIALETGVADGPDFPLAWDSVRTPRQEWWPAAWSRDNTLATALPASVVWYYQELARRIGTERMQRYVDRFGYGNRDISGGIDRFWLSGGLRISAREQVAFLRRFYFGELGVSARATGIAKELLVLEEGPGYRLSGKTGLVGLGDSAAPELGWLVGYLERDGGVYFFAMNLDVREPGDAEARHTITRAVLRHLGLMDGVGADTVPARSSTAAGTR